MVKSSIILQEYLTITSLLLQPLLSLAPFHDPWGKIEAGTEAEVIIDNEWAGGGYCKFGTKEETLNTISIESMDKFSEWFMKVPEDEGFVPLPPELQAMKDKPGIENTEFKLKMNEKDWASYLGYTMEKAPLKQHPVGKTKDGLPLYLFSHDEIAWWEIHTKGMFCMNFFALCKIDEVRVWSSFGSPEDTPQNTFRGQFKWGDIRVKRFTERLAELGEDHITYLQYSPMMDGVWDSSKTEPLIK